MKIYKPMVLQGFEWVTCCNGADYELFRTFDGTARASSWTPVCVRRLVQTEGQRLKPSDLPWLGSHALVMRPKAVEALRDVLAASDEILPLLSEDDVPLFVLNVGVADALDETRSEVVRFPGSQRIMRLTKVAFIEAEIEHRNAFRLPHRASPTYVSELFVERIRTAGLVGLGFIPVWASGDA